MANLSGISKPMYRAVDVDLAALGLGHQGADLEGGRLAGLEVPQQVLQREPGVDDVLDDQHVAPLDGHVEVLEDPHDAGGVGPAP